MSKRNTATDERRAMGEAMAATQRATEAAAVALVHDVWPDLRPRYNPTREQAGGDYNADDPATWPAFRDRLRRIRADWRAEADKRMKAATGYALPRNVTDFVKLLAEAGEVAPDPMSVEWLTGRGVPLLAAWIRRTAKADEYRPARWFIEATKVHRVAMLNADALGKAASRGKVHKRTEDGKQPTYRVADALRYEPWSAHHAAWRAKLEAEAGQ